MESEEARGGEWGREGWRVGKRGVESEEVRGGE